MTVNLVDANLLIRFLTGDDPKKAKKVKKLLSSGDGTLWLMDITLAEIVWTLTSFYELDKAAVIDKIRGILVLPSIRANKKILSRSLDLYSEKNVDFIDAYLAAVSLEEGVDIYSLDKDFDKIEKVKRLKI